MNTQLVQLLECKEKKYLQKIEAIDATLKSMHPQNPVYYKLLADKRHWQNSIQSVRDRLSYAKGTKTKALIETYEYNKLNNK